MIVTARQLDELHRQNGGNGQLTLPYRARLTPLASDWVRSRRIVLGYGDAQPSGAKSTSIPASPLAVSQAGMLLWWCDGPCGPAKAAIVAYEKESALRALGMPEDSKQLVPAIRAMAAEVKTGRASGAVLLVQNGAASTVLANRCPSLRAVLGTCLEAVEQGVQQVAANVLIIEHPRQTLQQVKNLLSRFSRANKRLSEEVNRQLKELASCG